MRRTDTVRWRHQSGTGLKVMIDEWVTGGYRRGRGRGEEGEVPASISLGHALDWEELAAGERPG